MIELKNVCAVYSEGTPFQKTAVKDINLTIKKGECIGLIGKTGSGKSTLAQLLNGLVLPASGEIFVDGIPVKKGADLHIIRRTVGLVFQCPEYQLFEETIEKDAAFAPKNYRLSDSDIETAVRDAMEAVGLPFEIYRNRSPFLLSGGEKRRAAIAGVLAAKPGYLILDEPTAGLDPSGAELILNGLLRLRDCEGTALVFISHSMEDIARITERVLILKDGSLISDCSTRETFSSEELLKQAGLCAAEITRFMHEYRRLGNDVRTDILTVPEATDELSAYLHKKAALGMSFARKPERNLP